jgi:hypothetical protein
VHNFSLPNFTSCRRAKRDFFRKLSQRSRRRRKSLQRETKILSKIESFVVLCHAKIEKQNKKRNCFVVKKRITNKVTETFYFKGHQVSDVRWVVFFWKKMNSYTTCYYVIPFASFEKPSHKYIITHKKFHRKARRTRRRRKETHK